MGGCCPPTPPEDRCSSDQPDGPKLVVARVLVVDDEKEARELPKVRIIAIDDL